MEGYKKVTFPEWSTALLKGNIVTFRWRLSNNKKDFTKETLHRSYGFSLQMMEEADWYIKKES